MWTPVVRALDGRALSHCDHLDGLEREAVRRAVNEILFRERGEALRVALAAAERSPWPLAGRPVEGGAA